MAVLEAMTVILALTSVSSDELSQLLAACQAERAQLLSETASAEVRGLPVYLERTTLEVSRYFLEVAQSDNSTAAQTVIQQHYEQFYTPAERTLADALARTLPVREANSTLQVLRMARQALAGASRASRPVLPPRNPTTICDGYFCNNEGAVVFAGGFNVWADGGSAPFNAVETGVTVTTAEFSAAYLFENLTFPQVLLDRVATTLQQATAANQTVHILMGQAMPAWAEAKWPGINSGNFSSHGFSYDIDNPGATIVTAAAITAFMDAHGCHPAIGGWILANEPDFRQSYTPSTLAKYHTWLTDKYGGVHSLNIAWKTDYASIGDILPPSTPDWRIRRLVGGDATQWWDWNTFNNLRVTQYFEWLAAELRSWPGPTTPRCLATTIKIQNGNEFQGLGGFGINRTSLIPLQTINGNDAGMAPRTALGQNNRPYLPNHDIATYNLSSYYSDWLSYSAGYALQRSLDPSKPVYNTESHYQSTLAWRTEGTDPNYIDFAVWLGLFHGEAMDVAWYFPRRGLWPESANQFGPSFPGSFGTDPAATDAYLRSNLIASAHGDVVATLGRLPTRIWLLRSWSSFALNRNSTAALLGTFESASFLGVPVGFCMEGQLADIREHDVVVIPGTTHVRDNTVAWLQSRTKSSPGTVVATFFPEDGVSSLLQSEPSGTPRSSVDIAWLQSVPHVPLTSVQAATQTLAGLPAIASTVQAAPGHCVAGTQGPSVGVLCKFVVVRGSIIGLVINLLESATAVSVVLSNSTRATSARDLRSGALFVHEAGMLLQLKPGEVKLLSLQA